MCVIFSHSWSEMVWSRCKILLMNMVNNNHTSRSWLQHLDTKYILHYLNIQAIIIQICLGVKPKPIKNIDYHSQISKEFQKIRVERSKCHSCLHVWWLRLIVRRLRLQVWWLCLQMLWLRRHLLSGCFNCRSLHMARLHCKCPCLLFLFPLNQRLSLPQWFLPLLIFLLSSKFDCWSKRVYSLCSLMPVYFDIWHLI